MKLPRIFKRKTKLPEGIKNTYSYDEVKVMVQTAHDVGYTDGKRDGISIARKAATNSLKEVLWEQKQNQK